VLRKQRQTSGGYFILPHLVHILRKISVISTFEYLSV